MRLRAGSPFSALVAFELWSRGRGLTLEACFAQDLRLARVFQSHPDFDEGIRARLIDKDQNPHWRAKDENEVPDAEIQALFPG